MNQKTAAEAFAHDGFITQLFNHADENEAAALQSLLVKCGYLWRCPECSGTFDFEEETCEFCGAAQPGRAVYEPHSRFEYDLNFTGGNYTGVGTFAYVPISLIKELTPEDAFSKHTGIDAAHIIHYTTDESFDAEGNEFDEKVAEALNGMRSILAQNTIASVIRRLAHFCSLNESYMNGGHENWNTAEQVLLQALARIAELEKDGQVTLPEQLRAHDTTEQTADETAALLEEHSMVEALAAASIQAKYCAKQDGEEHAAIWKEAITLIIEQAIDTLNNLPPTPMLNY